MAWRWMIKASFTSDSLRSANTILRPASWLAKRPERQRISQAAEALKRVRFFPRIRAMAGQDREGHFRLPPAAVGAQAVGAAMPRLGPRRCQPFAPGIRRRLL